ncbi:MAG: hypothetical protein G3M78_01555 [Candidatus Nitrohelix vancouverensis]|uniref:Uncharacterized protein n=1 Tax=Candidatus Nitrohelix vancouverensis TaxID=2705534 RepID=A0A7T0C0A9_9BACT|nr:MAG: hypothetical protein G3M78_01555 [Candidatus Nitrohelix vancouverensis]
MARLSPDRKIKYMAALGAGLLLSGALLFVDFEEPVEHPDLRQAERVARRVSSLKFLKQTPFYHQKEMVTPSRFVDWMLSPEGKTLWYVPEGTPEFSSEELKFIQKIVPISPNNVELRGVRPDPEAGRQLVLIPLDETFMLAAEGYLDPQGEPVFRSEWKFPKREIR